MNRTKEIIKRLQREGVYLSLEHGRTDGGEAIVVAAGDFLFPQYDGRINKLKRNKKAWLKDRANVLLNKYGATASAEVVSRWKSIIDGTFFE